MLSAVVVVVMGAISLVLIVSGLTGANWALIGVVTGVLLLLPVVALGGATAMLLKRRAWTRWVYAIAAVLWFVLWMGLFQLAGAPFGIAVAVSTVPVVAAVLVWLPGNRAYFSAGREADPDGDTPVV